MTRKKIFVVVILLTLTAVFVGILLYKPFNLENQHPRPELIGTLKFPEYLDGGCISYSAAEKVTSTFAITNPPYISRPIALKNIDNTPDFWEKIKQSFDMSKKWIISSYSNSLDNGIDKNTLFILININDWASLDYTTKYRFISEITSQTKGAKIDSIGEVYIYTCENPGSKWVGYAKVDSKETLIRFDWRRSILEEFLDNINPFDDPDPA